MNYFVNVWEISEGSGGDYRTYRLYSGDSVEDIKFRIVGDLKDSWNNVSDEIDNLENPTDLGFDEIGDFFTSSIEDAAYAYIKECHIEISNPYTDVMEAVRFYRNYEDDDEDMPVGHIGFYTYGEYANKLEKALAYVSSIVREYDVHISSNTVTRICDLLT